MDINLVRQRLLPAMAIVLLAQGAMAAPIHEAAKKGDVAILGTLLDKNPNLIEARDNDDRLPLSWAVSHGNLDAVKFLVKRGAKINTKSKHDPTPLGIAATPWLDPVFKFLLENGADPNGRNDSGETALHRAAGSGYLDAVKLLLAAGAKADSATTNGNTPLWEAQLHITDPFHQSEYGSRKAALARYREIAQLLIESGADINVSSGSMLSQAVLKNQLDVLRINLDLGASVKGYDCRAIHYAFHIGDDKIVRTLLDSKRDIDSADARGWTLVHMAAHGWDRIDSSPTPKEHIEEERKLRIALQALIERKAAIDLPNGKGETPLFLAAESQFEGNLKLLMEKGAEPKKAVSKAISYLNSIDRDSYRALQALGALRGLAAPAVPAIDRALQAPIDSGEPYFKQAAKNALEKIGTPEAIRIAKTIRSKDR